MKILSWNDEWNTNVPIIDEQHKQLIDLLNSISSNSISDKDLIEKLIFYISNHFLTEEKIMFQISYPYELYHKHRQQHNDFTELMLEISFKQIYHETVNEDFSETIDKLKTFCFTWFQEHFLKTDKELSKFIHGGENIDHILLDK